MVGSQALGISLVQLRYSTWSGSWGSGFPQFGRIEPCVSKRAISAGISSHTATIRVDIFIGNKTKMMGGSSNYLT